MTSSESETTEPVPISRLLDTALGQLSSTLPGDGFLFSGNRHETVPRALLLDRRLTPLERNAWQVFRLLLSDDGVTAFPTYDQLRPYLASMPCVAKASHETVARALTSLRLTRWLSLARRRRDLASGRILANLYVLHDDPLTPYEAMQIDPDYLGLISHALTHASMAIQRLGHHVLGEIANDPLLTGRSLPTRLQMLAQHIADGTTVTSQTYPQPSDNHKSEVGDKAPLRIIKPLSSDSEAGLKASKHAPLPIPKQDRTEVLSSCIQKERTVPRVRDLQDLRLPDDFLRLKGEQQSGALVALKQVEHKQRQAVLDEWAARCRKSTVRNPAGYLFGIIQKAIKGDFKVWTTRATADQQAPTRTTTSASPELVRTHLAQLRNLLDRTESNKN